MPKGGAAKAVKKSTSSQSQETVLSVAEFARKQYLDSFTHSQTPLRSTQESLDASQTSPALRKRSRSQSTTIKSKTNIPIEGNNEHKGGTTTERHVDADGKVVNAYGSDSSQNAGPTTTSASDGMPSQSRSPLRPRYSQNEGRRERSPASTNAEVTPCVEERRRLLQQIPLRCIPIYKRLAECCVDVDDRSFAAVVTKRAIEAIGTCTDYQ